MLNSKNSNLANTFVLFYFFFPGILCPGDLFRGLSPQSHTYISYGKRAPQHSIQTTRGLFYATSANTLTEDPDILIFRISEPESVLSGYPYYPYYSDIRIIGISDYHKITDCI